MWELAELGVDGMGLHSQSCCTGAIVLAVFVLLPGTALANHEDVVDKLDRGRAEIVSRATSGDQGNEDSGANGHQPADPCLDTADLSASDDGRIVVFASRAGNLHPADVNGQSLTDIFTLDRKTGRLELVSALPAGLAANPPADMALPLACLGSSDPVVSGNGRYVAFASNQPLTGDLALALAPGNEIFVRDLKKNETELVSVTHDGELPLGLGESSTPSISDNGRHVAFLSLVNNLVEEEPRCSALGEVGSMIDAAVPCAQVYVRDRKKDVTTLASKSSEGESATQEVNSVSLSGNGRFVAFHTAADNLVENDLNFHCFPASVRISCFDVYLHDLRSQKTELISVGRGGGAGNFHSDLPSDQQQIISDDGRFVLFRSTASDLVPANPVPFVNLGVYVRDRKTNRMERVSVSSSGVMMGYFGSTTLALSDDGRYLSWIGSTCDAGSVSTVCPDHLETGLFVHDRQTGQVDWASADQGTKLRNDPPPDALVGRWLGGNARFLIDARTNDALPEDKNKVADVFVRNLDVTPPLGTAMEGSRVALTGDRRFSSVGFSNLRDAADDAALAGAGAELLGGALVLRPELEDLFFRIEIDRMWLGALAVPVSYGLRFDVEETTYEVRTSRIGAVGSALSPTFLLRGCTGDRCIEIAELRGGYGTTGERVVFSLPLDAVGLNDGGTISDVEAFSYLGALNAERVLDRVTLN